MTASLPEYLNSYDLLVQHLRAELEGLSTTRKGERFARFVEKLLPETELGSKFERPAMRAKKSADEGVDLTADSKDGLSTLCIQSKMWVDRAERLDSILSSFLAYLGARQPLRRSDGQLVMSLDGRPMHFLVVTLSRLQGVRRAYEARDFATKDFYRNLVEDEQLHFLDGQDILFLLQAAYRRIGALPANLVLNLAVEPIRMGSVHMGIMSSTEPRRLYGEFDNALFFENIRDFIVPGTQGKRKGRVSPNDQIIRTIREEPDKMLERNNGIVFRAGQVTQGDSEKQLELSQGSVVNGCQTTMCLVRTRGEECYVPVKVVQTDNAWDIAKAANLQNAVPDIDLELARNLRPQLAKRAAAMSGVQIEDGDKSAFQVMEEIYGRTVIYNETRLLYVGLLSRRPNNVFTTNYTELLTDVLDMFYEEDPLGEETFDALFAIQQGSQEGFQKAQETLTHESYRGMFDRLYKESGGPYRALLSILALSGATGMDVATREADPRQECQRMRQLLKKARKILDSRRERFLRYCLLAVKTWMMEMLPAAADETEIRQRMAAWSRQANFTTMLKRLVLEADTDDWLRSEAQESEQRGAKAHVRHLATIPLPNGCCAAPQRSIQ